MMKNSKIKEKMTGRTMQMIEIGKLVGLNGGTDRSNETEEDLSLLRTSLEDSAFIEPVSVAGPYANDTYAIVSGLRRVNALKTICSMDLQIPCYVIGNADTPLEDLLRMRAEANLTVKRPDENSTRLLYCSMLAKKHGIGSRLIEQMQAATGLTDRYCRSYRNILVNGTPVLKNAIFSEKKIRINDAAKIANEAPGNETVQERLLDNYFENKKLKKQCFEQRFHFTGSAKSEKPALTAGTKQMPPAKAAEPRPKENLVAADVENAIYYMLRVCEADEIPEEKREELGALCRRLAEKIKGGALR